MVAESRTARGARGCTEMNLLFKKNRKKKLKKITRKTEKQVIPRPSCLQPWGPFSVWGDRMGTGDAKQDPDPPGGRTGIRALAGRVQNSGTRGESRPLPTSPWTRILGPTPPA